MRIKKNLFNLFCLAILLLAFGLGEAQSAPGDLDPTFGTGGDARGNAVAVQPDRKIIMSATPRTETITTSLSPVICRKEADAFLKGKGKLK